MTSGDDVETLEVDDSIYPLEAIYRACYWLTDRAFVFLTRGHTPTLITVRIRAKKGYAAHELSRELENALLDHSLRSSIAGETAQVRDALLREAFPQIARKVR